MTPPETRQRATTASGARSAQSAQAGSPVRMSAAEYRAMPQAKARFVRGQMNATEADYAWRLDARMRHGEIVAWRYEAITLRLAERTTYTPDFLVLKPDGAVELYEVKGGFIREDANVKLKVAAAQYPWFRFLLVRAAGRKGARIWSAVEVHP